jgi:hypothetical protein
MDLTGGAVIQVFGYGADWAVTEIALPLTGSMPLSDALFLDVASTPAMSTSSGNGGNLFGMTNTKVRGAYLLKDWAIFTLGFKLPTWVNKFDTDDLITMGRLSKKGSGFVVTDYFQTLDMNVTGSGGYTFPDIGPGDLTAGLGIGYLFKGPYSPAEDLDYSPGNQLNISLAVEYVFLLLERRNRAMLDIGYTNYGQDKLNDQEVFELGSKKNWALSLSSQVTPEIPVSLRLANYWANGASRVSFKGELKDAETTVNQDFYMTATAGIPMLPHLAPYGQVTLGFQGEDDNQANNGFVTGLGVGGSKRMSEHIFLQAYSNLVLGGLEGVFIYGLQLGGKVMFRY